MKCSFLRKKNKINIWEYKIITVLYACVYIPIRLSVFCLKLSLGVVVAVLVGAVILLQGTEAAAVGKDLAMAKKSWMSL